MKVTAVDKYTGEKIYELEMKECEVEHSCPDYTPERCYTFCPQFDAMGIERASDQWQVRAIERDTGKLIVFPHVFDDPDEVAHQFVKVCRSPHYRSVDIALVLD